MPDPDNHQVWWTWNMALAWVMYRRMELVEAIAKSGDYAFALGEALVAGEFRTFSPAHGYGFDQGDGVQRAQRALREKIEEGKIQVAGWPIGGRRPQQLIEPHQWNGLKFSADEEDRGIRIYRDGRNTAAGIPASTVEGFFEPRVRADDLRRAFPGGGKKQTNDDIIRNAIDHLVRYLLSNPERHPKDWYRDWLQSEGFGVSANAFKTQIWPAAIEESKRYDLGRPGRRGNR
ncbi:MAG: hypothetical protein AB7L41_04920 [Flavobacteriaceae bacterium]